jgi:hypothetical protein
MHRRFQLWWELSGRRWAFWLVILALASIVAFWVSGKLSRASNGLVVRYRASSPVLLTHHLEVRACQLRVSAADVRVRFYFTNRSTLSISDLHFAAYLDEQPPLVKPEAIRTLLPVAANKVYFVPVDTKQVEVCFPPASQGRLRVIVQYTVRSLPPTVHVATREVFLKPCQE